MKIERKQPLVVSSLVLLMVGAALAADAGREGSSGWREAPLWDDGNAEFCVYDVGWSRYGRVNPGQAFLVAVKEPWAPDLEVKADAARPNGFDVLKLNHVRDVQTGIYTYHQMVSVFLRRDDARLQKLSATSSEGCGISTAHLVDGRLNTRSYFDGQGERDQPYPQEAIPEDGLALALREFVIGSAPAAVEVFPSLMTGRFPALEPSRFGLTRTESIVEVTAGRFEVVEIELRNSSRRLTFAFGREIPHTLISFSDDDGTSYSLSKCERIPYWQMNGPGGENWLPSRGR